MSTWSELFVEFDIFLLDLRPPAFYGHFYPTQRVSSQDVDFSYNIDFLQLVNMVKEIVSVQGPISDYILNVFGIIHLY